MARGVMRLNVDEAGGQAILTDNGTVFCNGNLVMRLGDRVAPHGSWEHAPYPPMVTASPTVFVEGMPVCAVGDLAACLHEAEPCSSDVFVP